MMNKNLFDDFQEVSAKAWKQKIQADLKGQDYQELLYHTHEGVAIKPFYHSDDFSEEIPTSYTTAFTIEERFTISSTSKNTLQKIKESLAKGSESLWLCITSENIDLLEIFNEIDIEKTPVYVEYSFFSVAEIKTLQEFLQHKKHQVSIGVDIIGNLAETGNWYENLNSDFENLSHLLEENSTVQTIAINAQLYQNSGANMVQQLAYSLTHTIEYLNFIAEKFPQQLTDFQPTIKVAIGSNYFFEIAKLKALRDLYASIAPEYGASETLKIHAFPTQRNKTLYDYNVNMLRTTTECMSAILGGADHICNVAYDEIYHHDNDFGRRIARNQVLILKNESYFDKVLNAADGSYYIETITQQLSEKALETIKTIEKGGGFLKALKEGTIQRKIKESAQKEQEAFDTGKFTLVGTNKYENEEDQMKQSLEIDPFLKIEKRKTLLPPIIQKRLSEGVEQERLAKEEKNNSIKKQ